MPYDLETLNDAALEFSKRRWELSGKLHYSIWNKVEAAEKYLALQIKMELEGLTDTHEIIRGPNALQPYELREKPRPSINVVPCEYPAYGHSMIKVNNETYTENGTGINAWPHAEAKAIAAEMEEQELAIQ